MADLKFRIVADLKKLKIDLQKILKEKLGIDVTGKGEKKGSKEDEKQSGLLSGIFGKLAIVAALIIAIKPIQDLIKIIMGGILFFILKIAKKLGLLDLLENLVGDGVELKDALEKAQEDAKKRQEEEGEDTRSVLQKIVDWIKALPDRLVNFMRTLPILIWVLVERGFAWIKKAVEFLKVELVSAIAIVSSWLSKAWESLKETFEFLKTAPGKIWDLLKIGFNWIKDKVQSVFDKLGEVWNKLGDVIDEIKTIPSAILELPNKIKEALTSLFNSIKNAIKDIFSFGGGDREEGPRERDLDRGVFTDFVSRPGQSPVAFSPQDTIIGVKDTSALGGTRIFNFYGVTPQDMIEIIKRELGTDITKSGRF